MKIIYMGTPLFAVDALESLANEHDVCAVFTQPDRQKGRGMKMLPPPVKTTALKRNIEVFQPQTLRCDEIIETIKNFTPDCIVVAAYGQILPKEVLQIPRFGCVNIHASVLPKFRGASPIQTAILHGETESGITTMLMNEGLDTGDILEISTCKITDDDNYQTLHDKLKAIGAKLVLSTLEKLESRTAIPIPQDNSQASYAGLISKNMAKIDFTRTAQAVHNQVRGLYKSPGAFALLGEKRLKIHHAKSTTTSTQKTPGTLVLQENKLFVACGDFLLEIFELQLEGSRALTAAEFMRGQGKINNNLLS